MNTAQHIASTSVNTRAAQFAADAIVRSRGGRHAGDHWDPASLYIFNDGSQLLLNESFMDAFNAGDDVAAMID